MKNYILLLLLMLFSNGSYSQTVGSQKQPVNRTRVQIVKGVDEKNKEKIGLEIRKRKVQRRGDRIKGKKSVQIQIEDYRVKIATKYC